MIAEQATSRKQSMHDRMEKHNKGVMRARGKPPLLLSLFGYLSVIRTPRAKEHPIFLSWGR
jgi:hypothetical protein